jgi:hypothetical protein
MKERSNKTLTAHTDEIVEMRLSGLTLQEIGDHFGVSRERIRQVLSSQTGLAGPGASRAALNRSRYKDKLRKSKDQILEAWRSGGAVTEIARTVDLPATAVSSLIKDTASEADHAERAASQAKKSAASNRQYSDQDILEAIRRVANEVGGTPSTNQYRELSSKLNLPSQATILKRMSWREALQRAGLEWDEKRNRRTYTRQWTKESVLEALMKLRDELPSVPTYSQYCEIASTRSDLPSGPTVRNRLAKWSEVRVLLASHDGGPHGGSFDHNWTEEEVTVLVALVSDGAITTEPEVVRQVAKGLSISEASIGWKVKQTLGVLAGSIESWEDPELHRVTVWFNSDPERGRRWAESIAERLEWLEITRLLVKGSNERHN